jgi:putative phosphoesterase
MQIAIISDIHDRRDHLATVLDQVSGADLLICCGDLCSPFIVVQLGEGFHRPIHVVFGNNDGDLFRISQQASRFSHLTLHGEFAELTCDGKRIAVNHFPEIARALAASDRYDLVCYGHDHQHAITADGETVIVNPGEVYGGLSGTASYAVYDTATGVAERRDLD